MTPSDRIREIAERAEKATPGPWKWFGSKGSIYLATMHSGRRYVMGFRRWGMNSAQPSFQENSIMVDAADLAKFEVGDGAARGFDQAKADPGVYRYDIKTLDNPDARLIEHCAEDIPFLLSQIEAGKVREAELERQIADLTTPRPEADYHEDFGNVLWWVLPIDEPPYCGSTLDTEFPGYHTHWTPINFIADSIMKRNGEKS